MKILVEIDGKFYIVSFYGKINSDTMIPIYVTANGGYSIEDTGDMVIGWGEEINKNKKFAVLLFGKAGVGKTTIARLFQSMLPNSDRIPMALYLKRCAKEYFGWDGKKDVRGRRLLQTLGTECGRTYNPNLWVDQSIDHFLKCPSLTFMISDDVRFANEIIRCRERLGKVFTIKVIGPTRIKLNEGNSKHISEHALEHFEDYDFEINNHGDLETLRHTVKTVTAKILQEVGEDACDSRLRFNA